MGCKWASCPQNKHYYYIETQIAKSLYACSVRQWERADMACMAAWVILTQKESPSLVTMQNGKNDPKMGKIYPQLENMEFFRTGFLKWTTLSTVIAFTFVSINLYLHWDCTVVTEDMYYTFIWRKTVSWPFVAKGAEVAALACQNSIDNLDKMFCTANIWWTM